MEMRRLVLAAAIVFVCDRALLLAQSVTPQGSLSVASADEYASQVLQDPWDMNQRTDFGWFLNGADQPLPQLTAASFSNGIFTASISGQSPNLFLLEPRNPEAATVGRIGTNYPINGDVYRLIAIRMNISGSPQGGFVSQLALSWDRDHIWDPPTGAGGSGGVNVTAGWRTYLIDIPSLGLASGSVPWSGMLRMLQLYPAYNVAGRTVQFDWIRLVNVNQSLCRRVTWDGFAGAVDLFLDPDAVTNGNESLLAQNVSGNAASHGCTPQGAGYTFYAGALAPGSYFVLVRPAGGGTLTRATTAYQVNAIPTITVTAPSDEGSADDFATTVLGNPWDMNATTDVAHFMNVSGPTITTINAETPGGTGLPNTRVLWGTSTQHAPPAGDPILAMMWFSPSIRIDPIRYRILTAEFGVPNSARSVATGSVARIVWRVAGDPQGMGVSDDIIFNHRAGVNVMDKFTVDMADRSVLRIEQGATTGWVPGNSANPGLDILRFDVHEFASATPFYVRRIKLAAFDRIAPGGTYTIRWTSSEPTGTVGVYYDTDKNPSNGRTLIGSKQAGGTTDSLVWTNPPSSGQYFIYVEFNDGQNVNGAYSRWPIVMGAPLGGFLTTPGNLRVIR
jgi:hypothetical protein